MRRWTAVVGVVVLVVMSSGCVGIYKDANLDPKPDWAVTECPPEDDAKYSYFIGSSGLQLTEEAARMKATEMARADAAATLSTKVERLWRYITDYTPQVLQKDPTMVRPAQEMYTQLRTEVNQATQMGKLSSIFSERRVKETRILWSKRQEVSFEAVALLRVPLAKIAHIDDMQRLKDKMDTMLAESLSQAEVLWRNGNKAAAVEKLKAELVHNPDNIAVLERLAIYEQEAGDLDAAVMHSTAIVNHAMANSAAKARASGRLKALIPAQKKEVIDKIVSQ